MNVILLGLSLGFCLMGLMVFVTVIASWYHGPHSGVNTEQPYEETQHVTREPVHI